MGVGLDTIRDERKFIKKIYPKTSRVISQEMIDVERMLSDRYWRLNNLYWVIDEDSHRVKFRFRRIQEKLYKDRWYRNVILKSRQHGITTFVVLLFLDACLFEMNRVAGIVADTLPNAKKIFEKVQYAYDNLLPEIKSANPVSTDRKDEFVFSRSNSNIYVSTSARTRTLSHLLISELGKISLVDPIKAKEIVHGSIPTVHPGNVIFIESTPDGGGEGEFAEICKRAENKQLRGDRLTEIDFKFHFFPWYDDDKNRIGSDGVLINDRMCKYFDMLEKKYEVKLSNDQKAWYSITESTHGDQMRIQHPSYPEEAFKSAIDSAYYSEQFRKARMDNRVCSVPYQEGILVNTCWDLGMDDSMAIWFYQIVGRELHFIDCYDNNGYGFDHYKDILDKKPYRYGIHIAPHDIAVREMGKGGMARIESAREIGIYFKMCPKSKNLMKDIDQVRNLLSICWFDESMCEKGIKMLEGYRREWNRMKETFQDYPAKTEHRHYADAFRTGIIAHKLGRDERMRKNISMPKKISHYKYV